MSSNGPHQSYPILGFGNFRVFPLLPWPITACWFVFPEGSTETDITKAVAIELLIVGTTEPVDLEGDECTAFIDWYLAISDERLVEPIHLISKSDRPTGLS